MASLTSIPEELLDNIVELVLLNEREPPTDLKATRNDRASTKRTRGDDILSWRYGTEHVLFETNPVVPAANALLLVNKQIHHQTTQAISRLFPNGVKYKLDALFVDEAELWPTWLCVPALSKQINTIDVTIRIFGRKKGQQRSAFVVGDGSPPQFVWLFYWLLEHTLRHGTSPFPNQPRDLDISIKTINLNFLSAEPDLKSEDTSSQHRTWRYQQRSFPYPGNMPNPSEPPCLRMHPTWLAKKVYGNLAGLPDMSYHVAAYGALLHERLGTITISSEGEEIGQVRMGDVLAELDFEPDEASDWYIRDTMGHFGADCRLLTFWNWKWATVQRRKAIGLDVGEEIVWPTLKEWRRWKNARSEYRSRINDGPGVTCVEGRCLCNDRGLEQMLETGETT